MFQWFKKKKFTRVWFKKLRLVLFIVCYCRAVVSFLTAIKNYKINRRRLLKAIALNRKFANIHLDKENFLHFLVDINEYKEINCET